MNKSSYGTIFPYLAGRPMGVHIFLDQCHVNGLCDNSGRVRWLRHENGLLKHAMEKICVPYVCAF